MNHEFGDYIADILNAAQEVEEFTEDMGFDAFAADRKTINAVIRSLEVMGEAAKRIPTEIRQRYPAIPWKQMAAMRDKLIHEYSGVDLQIVWAVVRDELPPLRPRIRGMAQDFGLPL